MPSYAATLGAIFLLLQPATAVARSLGAAQLEQLRAIDLRLARIAYRLATANAPLCAPQVPATGMVLHALDQYAPDTRPTARGVFGFDAPLAVEGVLPDGPAARAGVLANDAVVAIAGTLLSDAASEAARADTRDAALATIERQAPGPLAVEVLRNNKRLTLSVPTVPACKTNFEVLLDKGLTASSDGRVVQIGVRWFEEYGDAEVAVIVAHELAHAVLRHRARLEAAGVATGVAQEFGRNQRLTRRIEDEADLLSASLLYNAGFDPQLAVKFWQGPGKRVSGGIFRSRTHASASSRAKAIADEIARIPPGAARPYSPPVLATRDAPLQ